MRLLETGPLSGLLKRYILPGFFHQHKGKLQCSGVFHASGSLFILSPSPDGSDSLGRNGASAVFQGLSHSQAPLPLPTLLVDRSGTRLGVGVVPN